MIPRLIETFKQYSMFSVTSHVNVEGDALGSQIALYLLLKKLGKKVVMVNQDPVPPSYAFLPSTSRITTNIPSRPVEVAVASDCSDLFRTGSVQEYLAQAPVLVNIDHHISNSKFGTVNWVDPDASSACEMVFHLCDRLKIMDKDIATCLYTGMYTDTGSFTYTNTTSAVHAIVSRLLEYPIVPQKIYHAIYSAYGLDDVHRIGRLISGIQEDDTGRIAWLKTTHWPSDLKVDLTETVFSLMRLLKKSDVLLIFKPTASKSVRVNFRSKGSVDVNKIAKQFGGGGHCTASGTTIQGNLNAVEREVIRYVKKQL